MKKNNLLLMTFLSLTLVSCRTTDITSFNISDWSTKLIDQNLVEEKDYSKVTNYDNYKRVSFSTSDIYSDEYLSCGLLYVRIENMKYGFYSLLNHQYIVTINTLPASIKYEVVSNAYVGFILYIKVDNENYCYDGYGNEIYFKSDTKKEIKIYKEDDVVCCKDSSYTIYKYYDDNLLLCDKENNGLDSSEKFINPIDKIKDLEIDIEGYELYANSSMISVYSEDGEFKTSYTLPNLFTDTNVDGYYYAGTSIVYQVVEQVADTEKEYDFSKIEYDNQYNYFVNKYVFSTYKFDLLTGKNKELDVDYLINEKGQVYKDKKGKTNYSLIELSFINKDKIIYTTGDYLINENGKVIANATGFAPDKFIKLENGNYYNVETRILYNSKLKEITHFDSISSSYHRGIGFIGYKNNKYCLIDENGVIALAFDYDYIDIYVSDGYVFALKNDELYSINVKTYEEKHVADKNKYQSCYGGLYILENNNEKSIASASKTICAVNFNTFYHGYYNLYFKDYIIFTSFDGEYTKYFTFEV